MHNEHQKQASEVAPAPNTRALASAHTPPSPPSLPRVDEIARAGVAPDATSHSTLSEVSPPVAGEGGEAGGPRVSNAEFVAAVFRHVPEGASAAVCSKHGDPTQGSWVAQRAFDVDEQCPPEANNYVNGASFFAGDDGSLRTRKEHFAACNAFMLDDFGTKVSLDQLRDFKPTWRIEASPGNFQVGIVFKEPITDPDVATHLHQRIVAAGLCDPGASGPTARWVRLPNGINGKAKYVDETGVPFRCQLVEWNPDVRYSLQEIEAGLGLVTKRAESTQPRTSRAADTKGQSANQIYTPRALTNPVVAELKTQGLYKRDLGEGTHDITCPWVDDHTDHLDSGTAYFEPSKEYPVGGFCCQHSHGDKYHVHHLLDYLGISEIDARHVAWITVARGEIDRVASAAEQVLADSGEYYERGGLISSIAVDAATGAATIVTANAAELTRALSSMAYWKQYDGRAKEYVRCDPPTRHINILCDGKSFKYLPSLVGLARQPYFRESDGELVTKAGYDRAARIYGAFDQREYVFPEPTMESARAALELLEGLLAEFAFATPVDQAAALSAILTATVRPTLPHAPAFHVTAPASGSGKSYLLALFGAFAGPVGGARMSYPVRAEEATKAILAALLAGPPVLEFDDMVHDWIAHGVVNRMLTSESIDERVLGFSKIAKVGTRTLVLGSGNNVGPTHDLLRRVLTIRIDRRSATPATTRYSGSPVEQVRKNRGKYVGAALTICAAWRKAGCPRTDVSSIATYGGAWADYCRHPLIWLGLPDPATALLEQVRHDPAGDALGQLLCAWYEAFGSMPTTVRKALDRATSDALLSEAIQDLPFVERDGVINRSKFGQYLRRNANRIVGGLEFRQTTADGRTAWQVVPVDPPPSPPSPPSDGATAGTVRTETAAEGNL